MNVFSELSMHNKTGLKLSGLSRLVSKLITGLIPDVVLLDKIIKPVQ